MRFSWAKCFIAVGLGVLCVCEPLKAAKPPSPAAVKSLQRLADHQGHPGAAARNLKNFNQPVPKEVAAAAAGVKAGALRRAAEQGGPLVSRLETARGRSLSPEQRQRIAAAESEHLHQVEMLRAIYLREVARATGLPEAKVQQSLAKDLGEPDRQHHVLAQLEKLAGRRLTAGETNRVSAARAAFRAAMASQRDVLAQKIGKISGVPSSVVSGLLP